MAPRLRPKGHGPPSYGGTADEFTVEINHGGFFVGFGHLRTYVDGKVSGFDHCEVDTWSTLWFEDFFEQLGYEKSDDPKVYWLLPGKELDDGLRILASDADTNAMCDVVHRVKNLILYFDHENTVGGLDWDDVVENPTASLQKVLSPIKVQPARPEDVQEVGSGGEEEKEGSDIVDSDNEVDEGDDDITAHNDEVENEYHVVTRSRARKANGSRLKVDVPLGKKL
ncbi:hypothetical protein BS78_K340100 [Paspalum vaginatum]|uniref:PB1-like domain-containing protein n=1 Tax=Paspalum vaginatum TaxID=158149 RepID=A0A9W7X9R5_9POAL|nr:hypothetical protein BS78_K340100 [Paspalum vaginatum]